MTAAFDDVAAGYDDVAESALGVELRRRVFSVIDDLSAPGAVVADLGCGTGIDAARLAQSARSVVGIDASPAMVQRAKARCADFANVRFEVADLETADLAAIVGERVDLVLANFGVVNCIGDIENLGRRIGALLGPNGHAVIVTMAPRCPTEAAIALITRNEELRTRRRGDRPASYGGTSIQYLSGRQLAAQLEPHMRLIRTEALGVALPTFEQRGWLEKRPRLLRTLAVVDRTVATTLGKSTIGDHHIAVLATR